MRHAPSVTDAYDMVDIAQCEFEELVGKDTPSIRKTKQAMVCEDSSQSHSPCMQYGLMAQTTQAGVSMYDSNALANNNIAEDGKEGEDGGEGGVISHSDFYQGAGAAGAWSATRGRAGVQSFALIERLKRYFGCGIWAGKLFCICVIVDYLIYLLLEMFAPRSRIDICKDWPKKISQAKQESGKRLMVDMDADKGTLLRKRSSRYRKSKREQLEDS